LFFDGGAGMIKNCTFIGPISDSTNDIYNKGGEVTFACADDEVGTPVQMQGTEITVIPPKELKCVAPKYSCDALTGLCKLDQGGSFPSKQACTSECELFKCFAGKCMKAAGGITKSVCESVCVLPTPPPTPPPAYKCISNKCIVKAGGVSKAFCESGCVPPPSPAPPTPAPPTPAPAFKCVNSICTSAAGGFNKSTCDAICG
jgi:hypothetical protein